MNEKLLEIKKLRQQLQEAENRVTEYKNLLEITQSLAKISNENDELANKHSVDHTVPDGYVLNIDVEKLLFEKLGKTWVPNCSIESLINELVQANSVPIRLTNDELNQLITEHHPKCQKAQKKIDVTDWWQFAVYVQLKMIEKAAMVTK